MTRALRALNASVGAAMVLLGLALPYAFFIDTGHAPGSDAFRLIQFHFVLTGAVSLWANASRAGPALSALLLVLAPLNVMMAPIAFFLGGEARLWPLLFALASLLAFVLYMIDSQSKLTEAANALDVPLNDLPPPDYAARPIEQAGAQGAVANVILVLAFGSIIAFAGGVYLDLIFTAVIYREPVDLAAALSGAESGGFARLFEKLRIEIISIMIGVALIGAFTAIWSGMLRNRIDAIAPDFDRALSTGERTFLHDAYGALATRFGEAPSSTRQRIYGPLAMLALPVAVLGLMIFAYGAEARALDWVGARRAAGADVLAYEGGPLLAAAAGSIAAVPVLFGVLQFAGARWPAFGRRLYIDGGWNSFALLYRRYAPTLIFETARQVRRRAIRIDEPFDIDAFVTAAFREYESLFYKTALAAAAATLFLFAADFAAFRLATKDAVLYSNYGQFVERRVELGDIDHVELGCVIVDPGERSARVKLLYVLVEEGAFRFDLLDGRYLAEGDFAGVEALDRRLADAGVTFFRAARNESLLPSGPGYIDTCAEAITARYEPEIAPRLIRLLRADVSAP